MPKLKIKGLTLEKMEAGKLKKDIPEFYELDQIIENNPWHNRESVFKHSLSVAKELKKLIKKASQKIKVYLDQIIAIYSRKELLLLAAFFHDIGKKETFKQENNSTKCLQHEEKSAEKLRHFLPKFNLPAEEKKLVIEVVRNHGFFHDLLDCPKRNLEEKLKEFKRNNTQIFLEVVLLSMADILGSQLKENKPGEFNFRINFLKKIIQTKTPQKS